MDRGEQPEGTHAAATSDVDLSRTMTLAYMCCFIHIAVLALLQVAHPVLHQRPYGVVEAMSLGLVVSSGPTASSLITARFFNSQMLQLFGIREPGLLAQEVVVAGDFRGSKVARSETQEVRHMRELEDIWSQRRYNQAPSFTRHLCAMLQPGSFTDFNEHSEFAEIFRRWTQRDDFRGLDKVRIWSLILNIKHVLEKRSGALAELGVYQGQCSAVLSYYAERFQRRMYLFDTFQGFSESQFEDNMGEGKEKAFKDTSLEGAQTVVGDYAGNRWIVGMFPASVTSDIEAETFAFVSIDCDIYEPISEGLRFFWPRMVPGGMVFVHDYSSGYWPGATRAVDEFCQESGVTGSLMADCSGSYVLAKPLF